MRRKETGGLPQRRIMMQKNNLKMKPNENPFSLDSVEAKKASLNGELNNWKPLADRIYRPRWNESTEPPVATKMVPCPPCVWG
jgi:hypothetical protein